MDGLFWAIGGSLATLLAMTVSALLVALSRPEPSPVIYDWELRRAAADVREKIEEIEQQKVNPYNGTVIVKATDLRWMRERLFPRVIR